MAIPVLKAQVQADRRAYIKALRSDLGWSWAKIAAAAGISSHTTLSRFANGSPKHTLSDMTLEKLRRTFGDSPPFSVQRSSQIRTTKTALKQLAPHEVDDPDELAFVAYLRDMDRAQRVHLLELVRLWVASVQAASSPR